jgi:hypothetical protein
MTWRKNMKGLTRWMEFYKKMENKDIPGLKKMPEEEKKPAQEKTGWLVVLLVIIALLFTAMISFSKALNGF